MTPSPDASAKLTAALIGSAAALPFDTWWLLIIPFGLLLGWMARAGRMIGERRSWREIRRDIVVSLLIGGANGLLAGLIIWNAQLGYMAGLAVSFTCAFGGVQSLDDAVRWARRHWLDDAAAEGARRQMMQRDLAAAALRERELRELADRIDGAIEQRKTETPNDPA